MTFVAAVAAAAPPAAAGGGWYLGGEAGWSALGRQEGSLPPTVFPEGWNAGFGLGGRLGYRFGALRLEEEFRYAENALGRIGLHPAQGSRAAYALMTNAIWDVDLGWKLTPHLGAGIGPVALHDAARVAVLGIPSVDDGTDWVFGGQVIAGLSYPLGPAVSAELDYRFLATTTPRFTTAPGLVVDGVATGGRRFSSGYSTHSVLGSVIWHFDGAP